MKVKELQIALQDIANVLEVAGTKSIQKDFQGILKLLDGADEQDLDLFLQDLESNLVAALKQSKTKKSPSFDKALVLNYTQKLHDADMDDKIFAQIVAEMKDDKNLHKAELVEIASLYKARPASTITKLHQSIRTKFYERIYDRDATEMARQATPW